MPELTAERLRELLHYDPETGVFTWRSNRPGSRGAEARAGCAIKEMGRRCARVIIRVERRNYFAHRLAWLYVHGAWPVGLIDHINGDSSDNRIANLRDANHSINNQNRRFPVARGRSGQLGVSWFAEFSKWRAMITFKGKRVSLGLFDDPEEAHRAYVLAKRRLHEGCTI